MVHVVPTVRPPNNAGQEFEICFTLILERSGTWRGFDYCCGRCVRVVRLTRNSVRKAFPLALPANANRRPFRPRKVSLYAMGLIGLIYLGSLVRTGYYLIKAALG